MRVTDPNKVKIGHWYTMCCEICLDTVNDEADLADIVYDLKEEDPAERLGFRVWTDKQSALNELRKEAKPSNP